MDRYDMFVWKYKIAYYNPIQLPSLSLECLSLLLALICHVLVEKESETLRDKKNIQMLLAYTFLSSRKSVVSVRD